MDKGNGNRMEVKKVKTCYGYEEYYWMIDGKPITAYLNADNSSLSCFGSLLGLLPAWSGKLIWPWENDFVWELVDSMEPLNVPLLVCEDDCDLSCIVIMAHVRKEGNKVYWDRLGALDQSNRKVLEYQQSGILCLEAYTDEDWEKYGDNIATERYGSLAYWNWVNENGYEEHIRQLRNYMKPYMQRKENMEWIWEMNWVFEAKAYQAVVEQYRRLKWEQDQKVK